MTNEFKQEISRHLNNENIFLYWKGRVALYALLKSMGIGTNDEVILPAYTCVVVPNAIIYLGAKPVYVDIEESTFNIDPKKVEAAITRKTKAMILQNTYGLSSNLETLISMAKERNLYTIEDCTHGFGGTYNGQPNGAFCDAAFYSTQWNKPFSTGIGGFAMINTTTLLNKLKTVNKKLLKPTYKEQLSLKLQLIARSYLVNKYTYWPSLKLYRYLTSRNFVLGSSAGGEINSTEMPASFFKGMSRTQVLAGTKALSKLHDLMAKRKSSAKAYTEFLVAHKKSHVSAELHTNHSFLKYPLLVSDRDQFLELAEQHKIMLGDWFSSPLHPVNENLGEWGFNETQNPIATKCASLVVNLPTDIGDKELENVLEFMNQHLDYLVGPEKHRSCTPDQATK